MGNPYKYTLGALFLIFTIFGALALAAGVFFTWRASTGDFSGVVFTPVLLYGGGAFIGVGWLPGLLWLHAGALLWKPRD